MRKRIAIPRGGEVGRIDFGRAGKNRPAVEVRGALGNADRALVTVLLCILLLLGTGWGRVLAPGVALSNPPPRLIALTFDDGPRPWVLKGNSEPGHASPSLLDLLDREGAKATFFVMGWRLAPAAVHRGVLRR